MEKFDIIVIGAGPGGYVAAIRASQLGAKVAIVESDRLGGVCLNKGCIPTKAVLKSAHAVHEIKDFKDLGLKVKLEGTDGAQAVKRANQIADKISKGVDYLMKKNKITVIKGQAQFVSDREIKVAQKKYRAEKGIVIATGARYRTFPGLEHDNKRLIGAWEAIKMEKIPKSIAIIGAGAIGVEFAYFWNAFGVDVHIFERQNHLLPLEDEDSSKEIEKAYKDYGVKLSLGLDEVSAHNNGNDVTITIKKNGKTEKHNFEMGLIAVGMVGNFQGLEIEKAGVKESKGFIKVNSYYQTETPHIYAIGDVCGPPLLAHAASHEGVIAVEHMLGQKPHALDPLNIPGCTYCQPQVASVGYTERALKEKNIDYNVGKLPFSANGKAIASNETVGFVKVLTGKKHGELLGAHIVGVQATELIHEYVMMRTMEGISEDIYATVHPHPTLGEWLSEAVMNAEKRSLNF